LTGVNPDEYNRTTNVALCMIDKKSRLLLINAIFVLGVSFAIPSTPSFSAEVSIRPSEQTLPTTLRSLLQQNDALSQDIEDLKAAILEDKQDLSQEKLRQSNKLKQPELMIQPKIKPKTALIKEKKTSKSRFKKLFTWFLPKKKAKIEKSAPATVKKKEEKALSTKTNPLPKSEAKKQSQKITQRSEKSAPILPSEPLPLVESSGRVTLQAEKKPKPNNPPNPANNPGNKATEGHDKSFFASLPYVEPAMDSFPRVGDVSQFKADSPNVGKWSASGAVLRSIQVSLPKEIAEHRRNMYTWTFTKAIRDLFPEVTFYLDREDGSLSTGSYESKQYYVELIQPIFKGFTLINSTLQEKYNRASAQDEVKDAIERTVFDAFLSFFEMTRAKLVYENHYELREKTRKYVKQSEAKKNQGLISEIEHLNVLSLDADPHSPALETRLSPYR